MHAKGRSNDELRLLGRNTGLVIAHIFLIRMWYWDTD